MLVLYRAADRFLAAGGRLGMVVAQTAVSKQRGRRRIPPLPPRAGRRTPSRRSRRRHGGDQAVSRSGQSDQHDRLDEGIAHGISASLRRLDARAARRPARTASRDGAGRSIRSGPALPGRFGSEGMDAADLSAGPSDYTAHLGANSGGANAIYWFELLGKQGDAVLVRNLAARAKRSVPVGEHLLEPDLLYPLLRWGDVQRWSARPRRTSCLPKTRTREQASKKQRCGGTIPSRTDI